MGATLVVHHKGKLQRFQSSPIPKDGRYFSRTSQGQITKVSILAHPEGWALLDRMTPFAPCLSVSILAHPEGWALRFVCAFPASCPQFQSSPIPKDGRYMANVLSKPTPFMVSILAHPEGWALPTRSLMTLAGVRVSILAHPEGWALLVGASSTFTTSMFQSSPIPKDGRYLTCCAI